MTLITQTKSSDSIQDSSQRATSPWVHRALWAAQILAALVFLAAGGAKLIGVERMVMLFEQVGFGQWLRYLTAFLEIGAAVLLLIPRATWIGAATLVCVMIGAVFTHWVLIGGSALPALVLLSITALIAWVRRPAQRITRGGEV